MMIGLFGCTSPKPEDFIGVWIGDNVKLELKSDGSCIATGQNAYLLLDEESKGYVANHILTGNWSLAGQFKYLPKKWYEHDVISIDLTNEYTGLKFGNILHYKRSIKSKSYTLYFDIGDPDDMNRFKFEKQ